MTSTRSAQPPAGESSKLPAVLRPGAHGDEVRKLQERLNRLGYHLDADGTYGPRTTAAIAHLQARSGLPVDGMAGHLTQTAITQHVDVHHSHLGDHWEREVRAAGHGAGGHAHPHAEAHDPAPAHPRPEDKPDESPAHEGPGHHADGSVEAQHHDHDHGDDQDHGPVDTDDPSHADDPEHADAMSHDDPGEADALAHADDGGHDDGAHDLAHDK